MKEYKIISIEDNKNGSDGHIIIVKANPLEYAIRARKFIREHSGL